MEISFTLLAAFISLIITYTSIPSIIKVAQEKHLYDVPDENRKSHKSSIPTLGGIAIFAGTIISASFFVDFSQVSPKIGYGISAAVILFFTGVKDDIIPLSPSKKLLAQIIASLIIILKCDIRLTDLYGFLWINDISYPLSIFISLFTMLVIINSFNLIDGINGLAGGIGFIVSATFGFIFYQSGQMNMLILAAALCGALLGFLRYNLIRNVKIFMGDTGSLTIGFLSAVFCIEFIELNNTNHLFSKSFAPVFAFSILIVPLFDTLRVFVVRVARKKSPFSGDRNHVHHHLIDLGFSHQQASFLLFAVNLLFISTTWMLQSISQSISLGIILLAALFFSMLLWYAKNRKTTKTNSLTEVKPFFKEELISK